MREPNRGNAVENIAINDRHGSELVGRVMKPSSDINRVVELRNAVRHELIAVDDHYAPFAAAMVQGPTNRLGRARIRRTAMNATVYRCKPP